MKPMSRLLLEESMIHPDIRERISNYHRRSVEEVAEAVSTAPWVIVGMKGNPHCKKARSLLDAKGVDYTYLEYGSYLKQWRRRSAIKMWTGWPTFPMVFREGVFVGGASELAKLL